MDKFSKFLEEKLMPFGEKIEKNRFLTVIRMSMMPTIPFVISGSMVLIILNFPYISEWIPSAIMGEFKSILLPIFNATMTIIALFISFLVGYNYMSLKGDKEKAVFSGLTTMSAFILVSPQSVIVNEVLIEGVIPTNLMGAQGMFVALLFSYIIAVVFSKLITSKLVIKMPSSVPPMVSNTFSSLIPLMLSLFFAALVNYLFSLTEYGNIHAFVSEIVQKPLMAIGTGLPALLISQFLIQLLWFFGLHGDQIVGTILEPILTTAGMENLTSYNKGDALPYIITQQFASLFVVIAFISLVLAIVIVGKSSRMKQMGKLTLVPAMFNISEPLVFGLPVVMNVMLFIPWVLVRPVFSLITWLFMKTGLCPAPTGVALPWTTPPILSGFLATNSIMGSIVQLICLAVGVLMFIPFVKMLDKSYVEEEKI